MSSSVTNEIQEFLEFQKENPETSRMITFLIVANNALHKLVNQTLNEFGTNTFKDILNKANLNSDEIDMLKHSTSIQHTAKSTDQEKIDYKLSLN